MRPVARPFVPILAAALAAGALAGCDALVLLGGIPAPRITVATPLPVDLPYRDVAGGLVLLSGRVNDVADIGFVLDTGAPISVLIDGERTAALKLDTSKAGRLGPDDDPAAPTGTIERGLSFAFGPVALEGVTAAVLPEASLACPERYRTIGFAGVIGADLFRRFVVEVDPQARRVRLHEPSAWRLPAGATVVPLAFEDGHPYIEADVVVADGVRLRRRLHFDTGMNRPLMLVDDGRDALPPGGEVRRVCFVSGHREMRIGPPLTLDVGGTRLDGLLSDYAQPAGTTAVQRTGALGGPALAGWRYAVDYAGRRLVLLERVAGPL